MKKRRNSRLKRHHHGMEHVLKVNLRQTRHRTRIIKLQSAIKVISEEEYNLKLISSSLETSN